MSVIARASHCYCLERIGFCNAAHIGPKPWLNFIFDQWSAALGKRTHNERGGWCETWHRHSIQPSLPGLVLPFAIPALASRRAGLLSVAPAALCVWVFLETKGIAATLSRVKSALCMGQKKKSWRYWHRAFLDNRGCRPGGLPRQSLAYQQQGDCDSKQDCENGGSVT
jgi:hypothetical protein